MTRARGMQPQRRSGAKESSRLALSDWIDETSPRMLMREAEVKADPTFADHDYSWGTTDRDEIQRAAKVTREVRR